MLFEPATVSVIRFSVPAVPIAQPRQRHRIVEPRGGKAFVTNYTPAKDPVNAYKAALALHASNAYDGPPLQGPLSVTMVFVLPRPQNKCWKTKPMPRYMHTGKPDRDNLMKSTQDALNGLLWVDDSQICAGPVEKWVASGSEQPHVEIIIEQIDL